MGIISLTDYFYNYKRSLKNENGIKEERGDLRRILIKNRETLAYLKENNDLLSQNTTDGKGLL